MYVAMLAIWPIHCFRGVLLHVLGFCFACVRACFALSVSGVLIDRQVQVLLASNYRWLDPQQPFQKPPFVERDRKRPFAQPQRKFTQSVQRTWVCSKQHLMPDFPKISSGTLSQLSPFVLRPHHAICIIYCKVLATWAVFFTSGILRSSTGLLAQNDIS
jgi:hypothetical protein